jgi:transcriptional regulator with XRE-family HTH domain
VASSRSPTPQQHFGAAVRRQREALGYSQERLAQLAGIHRNYAGAVERGERNVALLNMLKIAKTLGLPLRTLVAHIDATLPTTDRIKEQPRTRDAVRARPKRSKP